MPERRPGREPEVLVAARPRLLDPSKTCDRLGRDLEREREKNVVAYELILVIACLVFSRFVNLLMIFVLMAREDMPSTLPVW